MAKVNNIIYLTDDAIYLKCKKKNEIIKFKIGKNIIINGKIANINKFMKSYEKLLKDNNLNNSLFGETIKVIVNPSYTGADISTLKNTLSNFNYNKILIDNETKFYKLNSTNTYLNIYDTYILLTYIDEYKKTITILIPENLFLSFSDLLNYIKNRVQDRELYLIGNGNKLIEIFENFENKYGNKTYLLADNEFNILNNALK